LQRQAVQRDFRVEFIKRRPTGLALIASRATFGERFDRVRCRRGHYSLGQFRAIFGSRNWPMPGLTHSNELISRMSFISTGGKCS